MVSWSKESASALKVKELSLKYDLDPIVSSILIRRKFDDIDNLKYFLMSNSIILNSPFYFKDMQKFVERIKKAIKNKERVFVFGDRDTDGITSITILSDWLTSQNLECIVRLPTGDDNYGLTLSAVDEAIKENCSLVITVDCGITSHESVKAFVEKGIDVLIIDHHLPQEDSEHLPPSLAVIDPKVEGCGYPFKGLSAAGVVSKCITALEFSFSNHYNVGSYLLTAELGATGRSVIVSLLYVKNMIEEKRIIEEWSADGKNRLEDSKIFKTLDNTDEHIYVYKENDTEALLKRAFGEDAKLPHFVELYSRIVKYFPEVNKKSLLNATHIFPYYKTVKHSNAHLDTFYFLFFNCMLKSIPHFEKNTSKCLDLVAISTVADLMPLLNENRTLVKKGLNRINSHPRASLQPFLSQKSLVMKPLTATDISFYISPIINSAGRMGNSNVALDTLMAKDKERVDILSRQLFALNDERRHTGDDAWKIIKEKADLSFKANGEKFVFVSSSEIPRGFTGLSASKALRVYHVPVVIVAEQDEVASGSIRTPEGVNSLEFIQHFASLLDDFGAHQCAGGFSLKASNLKSLKDEMCRKASEVFSESYEEIVQVDCELPSSLVSPELMNVCDFFAPYGAGNTQLVFMIKDFVIEKAESFNVKDQKALRCTLRNDKMGFSAIGWSHGEKLDSGEINVGDTVNVLTTIEKNYFRGNYTMNLVLIDIEKSR